MKAQLLVGCVLLALAARTQAASITVYDSIDSGPVAGVGDLNSNNPIFGDALTLSQGGTLNLLEFTLFNSSSNGNTGSVIDGQMHMAFYDNTTPYAGGTLADPVLKTVDLGFSFGSPGLAPGQFALISADLSGLSLVLPQDILITQQFTETTGTSTENGIVFFNPSAIGSSSQANFYLKSALDPENLYSASTNEVGYIVTVAAAAPVPLPSGLASGAVVLGGLLLAAGARRKLAAR